MPTKRSLSWLIAWLLALLMFVVVLFQQVQLRQIDKALALSNQFIQHELNSFSQTLGRAETQMDSTGRLVERLADDIPSDIREDLRRALVTVQGIGSATLQHTVSGGGAVVWREPPSRAAGPDRGPPGQGPSTHASEAAGEPSSATSRDQLTSWDFSDWRLSAALQGDLFTYALTQTFDVFLVEGSSDAGLPTYLRVWELDSEGARIEPPLKVVDFKFIRRQPLQAHFKAFNPKLDIALSASSSFRHPALRLAPELGLSFMSYGEGVNDLSWRFLRFGFSHDGKSPGASVAPVSYNLARQLPLVTNVWLSPAYIWSDSHGLSLTVGGVF